MQGGPLMARAAALTAVGALGVWAAFDIPLGVADPPADGRQATVYRTVTETRTVGRRLQGRPIRWWADRAVANRRALNGTRITLRRIQRSLHTQVQLGASGLERAFLCVHGFEGSWQDPAAPYYGGLQMDWDFMGTYGGPFLRAFGPASNWTPAMQIATAERAYLEGRGWGPWPNTARMCGLR